jgi:hypothetical protein
MTGGYSCGMKNAYDRRRLAWVVGCTATGMCVAIGVSTLGVFTLSGNSALEVSFPFLGVCLLVVRSAWRGGTGSVAFLAGAGAMLTIIAVINVSHVKMCNRFAETRLQTSFTWPFSWSCGVLQDHTGMIAGLLLLAIATLAYLRSTPKAP